MAAPGHAERPAGGASPSAALRLTLRLAGPALGAATEAFWQHPRLAAGFPEYLSHVHASVRATVPLMRAAEARCRELGPSDPLAARLAVYFAQHALEELDHEEWLLRDMESIGMNCAEARQRVPPPTIAALAGAQYYWIFHAHPVALLGYFAVLEGIPPDEAHLASVRERTGLPEDGFRMLIEHARLDPQHGDEVFDLLDELPLNAHHRELVGVSALYTMECLTSVFLDLVGRIEGVRA